MASDLIDNDGNDIPPWSPYSAGISSVELPDGLTSLMQWAFRDCTSLTSIVIPNSVTSIGYGAFQGCSALSSITISNSLASVGSNVFQNCTSLSSAIFRDGTTSIPNNFFQNCTGLTSVTIPDSVTSIGSSAFYNCSSLTSVTIPDGITSINDSTFSSSGLTSVTIPDSVTSIGNYAFYNCPLTSIAIPDSVTSIGNGAFSSSGLTSITIPETWTSIGSEAFGDCYSLTEVIFTSSVAPTLAGDEFGWWETISGGTIYYPAGASGYTEAWRNPIYGLASWTLVQPVLQADTTELVFAPQTAGTSSSVQVITIEGADLTSDISCTLSGSSANAFALDTATVSSTGGTLSITFTPTTAGTHSATLTLSADSIPGSVITVITLSGTANAAPVADTPSTAPPAQDNSTSTLPQTGDIANSNSLLFLVAFVASGSALILLGLRAKRRKTT